MPRREPLLHRREEHATEATNHDGPGRARKAPKKTIADYVGDMVALESHIGEALDKQLTETQDDPEAREAVQGFHNMVKAHRDSLKALQEEVGTTSSIGIGLESP